MLPQVRGISVEEENNHVQSFILTRPGSVRGHPQLGHWGQARQRSVSSEGVDGYIPLPQLHSAVTCNLWSEEFADSLDGSHTNHPKEAPSVRRVSTQSTHIRLSRHS